MDSMTNLNSEGKTIIKGIVQQLQSLSMLTENNLTVQNIDSIALPDLYGLVDKCLLNLIDSPEFKKSFVSKPIKINLEQDLRDHLNNVKKMVYRLTKETEMDNLTTHRLKEIMLEMEKVINSEPIEPKKTDLELDKIEANIRKRFAEEKRQLKIVISSLLPNNTDLQNLLGDVIGHFFSSKSEEYYQLEYSDNISEHVNFLLRTHLFKLHPNDPLKIRMVDLS